MLIMIIDLDRTCNELLKVPSKRKCETRINRLGNVTYLIWRIDCGICDCECCELNFCSCLK